MGFDLASVMPMDVKELSMRTNRQYLLDKIIHKYGFENDITIEFARNIELVPFNDLGEAIIRTIFKEYMCMSE